MMFRDIVVISIVILSFGPILSIDFPIVSNVDNNSLSKFIVLIIILKSASNLNGNLNCSKELEHYAS